MRISKTFNDGDKIPLLIQTLAKDEGSAPALGEGVAEHLEAARAYFDDPKAPPPDPNNSEYRSFALPILDAFLEKTDPTFTPSPKGTNPSSEHADWITKIYADCAADEQEILSEDLSDIHDEIAFFMKAGKALEKKGHPTSLSEYPSYDKFTKIIVPIKLKQAQKSEKKLVADEIKAETSILYDGAKGKIVVPHTVRASQFWGQTTKWCISGEDAGYHFGETYNPNSPCLMYVPKSSKLETNDPAVVSGKVAVVENVIYNEMDKVQVLGLPDYIQPLREVALASSDKGKAEYIKVFGDMVQSSEQQEPEVPDWSYLEHLPEEQQDFLKAMKSHFIEAYDDFFVSRPDLAKDKDFVLAAVQQNGLALGAADETLKINKKIVLAAVQQEGMALQYADETLKINKKIVLAAVQQNGLALQYADETLKIDEDIVLAAVRQNGWALRYADETLKINKKIVLAAVRQNGWALRYADETLKINKKIVLASVRQNGLALQFAHKDLTKDEDIVLVAIQQSGFALEHADERLQNTEKIVLAAIRQDGNALFSASERLQTDRNFVLEAVRQNETVLLFADPSLFEDAKFVEGLLDIAEQGDEDQKFEVLQYLHRAPALFGHMSADIGALRGRLQNYSMEQNQEAEFDQGAVPEELLLSGDVHYDQPDTTPS